MSTQTEFCAALLDPRHPEPAGVSAPDGSAAGRRFAVYRNNVVVALCEALAASFPTIVKLLGPNNFNAIAGVFVRQNPPKTPLMMFYGAGFPEFLAGFEPLAHLPYLADVARLELALRESYHAADSAPAATDALARIAPEALPAIRLTLAPPVRVLSSDWPIHGIWLFNQSPDAPQPPAAGQSVLITRPDYDPEMTVITAAQARFVTALQAQTPLGLAMAQAVDHDPGFELSEILSLLLTQAALTHIES